jgi:hypothetical protein
MASCAVIARRISAEAIQNVPRQKLSSPGIAVRRTASVTLACGTAIHVLLSSFRETKTWMAGSSPAMTRRRAGKWLDLPG